ncbi:uncharacterized protein LOC110103450 isoform X2 [Dendrobium catenatum]|uniref:uncharacterized protein LOC110103450 isoform X2 n=1 Tax=Dendrobium catenatum TaxID=906689 RepID=UPI0010A0BEC2|nr:uncharacterized protein LOC110103450 isoform X2 [Dendrobium catenatum]XP_028555963.1 uncharacterized protein LOC110103450 isoform X2 [Dendrobium catenatum]XP_028555964.1 uncharacterized protein LOC110103450 isoform X2 [Dendrobium catenatum]
MAYHLEKLCCWELWHPVLTCAPTWAVLKITFMMLAICLIAMLSLAFISSDFIIVGHVILLVIIGAVLFVLLNGFLAQTGLVSVEQQIEEMGISQNDRHLKDKKKLALLGLQEAEARATRALKHELHLFSPLSTLYRKREKLLRNSSSTLPFKCSGEVPF